MVIPVKIRRFLPLLLFVLIPIAVPAAGIAQENPPREAGQETEQAEGRGEQQTEKQEEGGSLMDLLRARITGGGSTAIEVLSRGFMETAGDWVTVRENAEINYRGTSILADLITFNRSTYDLRAQGNVVLIQQDVRLGGDEMEFNLRDRTGNITNPFVETSEGYILAGRRLEKYAADRYRIEGASITSCTQPTPYWRLKASSIDFQVDKAANLKNVRFLFGKMPVLYMPWLRLPMNNERSSGLLMPVWGTSDFHGKYINTEYFWAINRSHDTSLGIDYYEKRGWRYHGEYRNDLGNNNKTAAYLFFIKDDFYGDNRYDGRVNSRQGLPAGFVATGDLQFLSDREYRRDFINRNIWYRPEFRRSASLSKNFSVYSLSTSYYDLYRFAGTNRISEIRYLPTVDFRGRERKIFALPVYYSFSANYTRPEIIDRRKQADGSEFVKGDAYHRLDLIGTLKMPIKTFAPWLTFTPNFSVRDTEYSKRYSPKKDRIVDKRYTRRYYDAGFQVTGPVFSRIFGAPEMYSTRYKHIVEPRLTYRWRSDIEKESRVIVIDQVDNFYKVHELQWSLNNLVLRKSTTRRNPQGEVVELLKVSLSQYVTLDDQLQTTYNKSYMFDPDAVEVTGRFSPLQINSSVRLSRLLNTNAYLEYSTSAKKFISYTININMRTSRFNYNFGWYKTLKQFVSLGFYRPASDRLVTNGSYEAFGGRLELRGAFDYDFTRKRILNYLAGFSINGQCLGFHLDMRKLNILGQQDFMFRFGLTIGGLRSLLSPEED
jgi:lipopolysaccharide assembly outer membrane protein LptD (OstA)